MASSLGVGRIAVVGTVAGLLVCGAPACGGKIAPSGEDLGSNRSGPSTGTGNGSDVGVGDPGHRPASAPIAVPAPVGSSSGAGGASRGATFVNGPIGFTVQDSFSFVTGPASNRELHGVWITSFTPACDKANAVPGSGVLRIDFSEGAGMVPPGTYPLEGPATPEAKTAFAQVWWVTAAGCGSEGQPGAYFESGSVTITRSDDTGMVGSFEGILDDFDGNSFHVDGQFDAPRCGTGGGACTP
jgi:hypothetical protein